MSAPSWPFTSPAEDIYAWLHEVLYPDLPDWEDLPVTRRAEFVAEWPEDVARAQVAEIVG